MKRRYDYESAWRSYANEEEEQTFLLSDEALMEVFECIDLKKKQPKGVTGCVPVHYDRKNQKLYVLSGDGHCLVSGETGSKKSRTVGRGSVIASLLSGNSVICVDPKGEICGDKKIQKLIKDKKYKARVLDFRTFDKDGLNLFDNVIRHMKQGREAKAMEDITRFEGVLAMERQMRDYFWETNARRYISKALQLLARVTVQKDSMERYFHLATLNEYVGMNQEKLREFCSDITFYTDEQKIVEPFDEYRDLFEITERTFSGIAATAVNLMAAFGKSPAMQKMLSVSTFDPRTFYEEPSILFVVIPDETKAYDQVAGYVMDIIYHTLVDYYTETYQGKGMAPRWINMICDEFPSIQINDMRSKIAASRSRQMNWVLIYQDDHQLEMAYPQDYGTILGNCKHQLFLGSCKYETLQTVAEKTGTPFVTAEVLQGMRKEKEYKEALLISGKYLYCAQLPDYDTYTFLSSGMPREWENHLEKEELEIYTMEDFITDVRQVTIDILSKKKKNEGASHNKDEKMTRDEKREAAQKELDKAWNELFKIGF